MRIILPTIILLISTLFAIQAQVIQKSNVYVFDLKQPNDTTIQFSKPRYMTEFNANGYNNHPSFFSNNELCLSVQMPGEAQPDLYVLDLSKKTRMRLTQTREGEFSPMLMGDRVNFSAVRQEFTPTDTLIRVWQFPLDRLNNGRPVFKYQNNTGYYYWLNSQTVAAFLNNNPPQLAVGDVRTDNFTPFARNVGRCFRPLPNGNLLFVQKDASNDWMLMQKKLTGAGWQDVAPTRYAETIPGAEDFAVLPDGSILMAKESKVYHFSPKGRVARWREVANLQFYDIKNITRLALSPDMKLALVAD